METKKVRIIGDSISLHYRVPLAGMTRGMLTFENPAEGITLAGQNLDKPMGLNAGDSRRTLEWLAMQRERGDMGFDLMLLNCGLHDIKRDRATNAAQIPLGEYRENLSKILGLIPQAGQRVIWVRITPVEDDRHNARASFNRHAADVDAYNAAADEVMAGHGIFSADLHTFTKNLPGEVYLDHVH
jgi:lysophospholipase L1-like esterase